MRGAFEIISVKMNTVTGVIIIKIWIVQVSRDISTVKISDTDKVSMEEAQ